MRRTITLALLLALSLCLHAFAEEGAVEVGGVKGDAARTKHAPEEAPANGEVYALDPSVFEIPPLDLSGRLPISLQQAFDTVLKESYRAKLARSALERSHFDLNLALAQFDPQFQAQVGAGYSDRSGTAISTTTKSSYYQLDLTEQFPTGDTFSISHELSRADVNQFGAGAAAVPNSYSNSLGVMLSHPLGRGAGRAANYWQVESALNRRPYQQLAYDDTMRNLRYQTYVLYFNLVAQKRELVVRQLNLELAMKLLERNHERHKVGLSIRADVLQAENNVLTQKSRLISSQKAYLDQLDQLSLLLGVSQKLDVEAEVDISPKDTAINVESDWPRVRAASAPLKQAEVQLRDTELNLGFLRNQLEPDLGLNLGYTRQGNDTSAGRALGNLEDESYNMSLVYKLPWGKRSYKARLAQGEEDLASAKVNLQETEQKLRQDWEALFRELEIKRSQIDLSENNVKVAQENYDIQAERNKVGLATTLDVVQAQESLLEAQVSRLFALVDYQNTYLKMQMMAGDI